MWKRNCVDPDLLKPIYSKRILLASFFALPSIFLAFILQLYRCCFVSFSVFLSSINYWRMPRYGFRRQLDVFIVVLGFWYQFYRSYECEYQKMYFLTLGMAVWCYLKARTTKDPNVSTKWHVGIHFWGNVGNMMLYMGMRVI